ncbi:site-specific DNA-methyltransferase, partial [Candidatus Poribacteria bacterium]|nr:site-specific DNA-methyltransferase [Candidatus Poribacteria bacterium]
MSDNLQIPLNFDEKNILDRQLSPDGYKGFAGFHKYWGKKPIEVWRYLIEKLTVPNDIVLDPFLGSGLLAKECVNHNCKFIGFDVNPISIELTKLFLSPPNYIDLAKAIFGMEMDIRLPINSMYKLSDGTIATHFLWDNDRIT